MAPPTIAGIGAIASGTAAITPAFPAITFQVGDLIVGIGETAGGESFPDASLLSTGFAHVPGSPVTQDSQTRLTVIWRRWTAGLAAHSWGDSGNLTASHNVGRYIVLRGVRTSGNPWGAVNPVVAVESVADTSATWSALTTQVIDCLILFIIATGRDINSTANLGVLTGGTGLTNIAESMDNWVSAGGGGGIGLVTATKAAIGSTGTPGATMGSTDTKALMTLALEPETGVALTASGTTTSGGSAIIPYLGEPTRGFDGANDRLVCSPGDAGASSAGARTWAAIIKRNASAFHAVMAFAAGAGNLCGLYVMDSTAGDDLAHQRAGGGAELGGTAILTGEWWLVAITKAAGTATPRGHAYRYSTSTWSHFNAASTQPDDSTATGIIFGEAQTGVDDFSGVLAVAGVWNSVLSDVQIETMEGGLQAWADLSPAALWPFNQDSTGTAVQDIIGGADQTSLTGTSIVEDQPPGFDFTVTTGLALTASGTTTSGGAATVGLAALLAGSGQTTSGGNVTLTLAMALTASGQTTSGGTATLAVAGPPEAPDAIISQQNLNGPVDRTWAPAGGSDPWLTADDPAVPIDLLVSFPTPATAPGSGGPTRFQVEVRKALADTTVTLELWEAGVFRAVVATDVPVTSATNQLLEGTFNPAVLTDPSGAGVQLRIHNTDAGGQYQDSFAVL